MSVTLKVPKLLFRFSLRAANSFATSIRQSLSVLCWWVLSIVSLLNLVCVIVERSHVFSLRAEEKELSPAALIAGFTRRSLHRVMISVIIHFSASESCLILVKMSSKLVNSPSFINTLNISSWAFNVLTSTAKKVGTPSAPHPARSLFLHHFSLVLWAVLYEMQLIGSYIL